jgi:hypothetical protein
MLIDIGTAIAALIAAGIIVIGAGYLWNPAGAPGFGIPGAPVADRAFRSWVRVKGVRDIGCGLFAAILLANGQAHLLGWFMLAAALLPVGDATIVLRSGGPKSVGYGIHAATAAVMLAGAILLLLG